MKGTIEIYCIQKLNSFQLCSPGKGVGMLEVADWFDHRNLANLFHCITIQLTMFYNFSILEYHKTPFIALKKCSQLCKTIWLLEELIIKSDFYPALHLVQKADKSPFYRWGSWSTRKWNDLPMVTKQVNGRPGNKTLVSSYPVVLSTRPRCLQWLSSTARVGKSTTDCSAEGRILFLQVCCFPLPSIWNSMFLVSLHYWLPWHLYW